MFRKLIWFCMVVFLWQMMSLASAQAPDEPFYLLYEQQIWKWSTNATDPVPIGETLPDRLEGMRLSPLSNFMVYKVGSPIVDEVIEQEGNIGGGYFPSDIWLLDLATGQAQVIAGQADDISADNALLWIPRSIPIWSADGSMLAWSEGDSLAVYDIASGETSILTDSLPVSAGVENTSPIMGWAGQKILVERSAYEYDGNREYEIVTEVLIYALDGSSRNILPHPDAVLTNTRIIRHNDRYLLALDYSTGWEFIDIETGEAVDIQRGTFASIAQNQSETSLRIPPQILDDEVMTELYAPDNSLLNSLPTAGVSFSPSGRSVLYKWDADTFTSHGWSADSGDFTIQLPWKPFLSFWGSRETILMDTDNPLITSSHCKGSSLSFRLQIGGTGFVLGSTANNMRSEANSESDKVGAIPANDWFTVLDGPVCQTGIAWWQVDYPPYEGWTAEGQGLDRWLTSGCPETGCGRG